MSCLLIHLLVIVFCAEEINSKFQTYVEKDGCLFLLLGQNDIVHEREEVES